MNIAPIRHQSYLEIKNDIQNLDVIFRTGGTVSNFSNPYSKTGYGFNLLEIMRYGAAPLMQIYNKQLRWKRNYLDIIGELIGGKKVIYVANIFREPREVEYAIAKLKAYGCIIEGVELGNEQFLAIRGMSGEDYIKACEKFKFLAKDYKLIYQLTKGEWIKEIEFNNAVLPHGESFSFHHYFKPSDNESPKTLLTRLKNIAPDCYLSEWNLLEGYDRNPSGNVSLAKEVLKLCYDLNIKHCYHNLVSDEFGVFDMEFKKRNDIYDLFPKV